jgi:hypothetical protein
MPRSFNLAAVWRRDTAPDAFRSATMGAMSDARAALLAFRGGPAGGDRREIELPDETAKLHATAGDPQI